MTRMNKPRPSLPFLRSSGFPFLTEAMNMSPAAKCHAIRAKRTSSRELVQTSTRASNGNHVQVLGTRVIGAVDHGAHRETERHSELVSSSTSTSYGLTLREEVPTTLSSSSHSWDIICPEKISDRNGPNLANKPCIQWGLWVFGSPNKQSRIHRGYTTDIKKL